jgi:excisionase family DNA binding protein
MQKLLSPSELASLLSVARQTVYNRISIGNSASLPKYIKLGSLVRFPLTEVEAWIALQINDAQLPKLDPLTIVRRRGRPSKAEQIARRSIQ